jgi:tetratricopeptide (TPR) repeat protein
MKNKLLIVLCLSIYNISSFASSTEVFNPTINKLDTVPDKGQFDFFMKQGMIQEQKKNWQQALEFYQKAAEENSTSGQPYIKIGMLYWIANESCRRFNKKLTAIECIRNFQIAEQFKDTKSIAKAKVEEFQEYLPTREEIFQRALKEGQRITTSCIFNVTVIIPKLLR